MLSGEDTGRFLPKLPGKTYVFSLECSVSVKFMIFLKGMDVGVLMKTERSSTHLICIS